jgi:DNA-binding GntR family transcriptional regulator
MTDPRPQLRRAATLKSQLIDMLIADMDEGVYQPGDKLPSEATLVRVHGVSKNTVEGAMQELKERGRVRSEHGKGTFVIGPPPVPVVQEISNASPWDELEPLGTDRPERGTATANIADLLAVPIGEPVAILHRPAVSRATGRTILTTRVIPYLVLEQTPGMPDVTADRTDLITTWKTQHGPLNATHYFRAVIPAGDQRKALGIAEPAPAQEHIRITETSNRRPLMLELFLSAADIRTYIRIPDARECVDKGGDQ